MFAKKGEKKPEAESENSAGLWGSELAGSRTLLGQNSLRFMLHKRRNPGDSPSLFCCTEEPQEYTCIIKRKEKYPQNSGQSAP